MLSCNFELHNDLHRKVREYNKLEGEKKAKLRQYVLIASAVVFLGGLIIKYSPKWSSFVICPLLVKSM